VEPRRRDQLAEGFERIQRDLTEERAAALQRISRRLESLIEQLHASRARLDALDPGDDRVREIAAYASLRSQALTYRWYLEVQREALGLYHHQRLDEFYKIPAPVAD
jgi:hypothetical protein